MSRSRTVALAVGLIAGLFVTSAVALAQSGPLLRPATWADGELFGGVVAPAKFDPANGKFDELYMCGPNSPGGFKDGVPLISDSKPGDQDYNGGRWHLNVLKPGVPCSKYANADSDQDLDLGDFQEGTAPAPYFECPLLPRRGNN